MHPSPCNVALSGQNKLSILDGNNNAGWNCECKYIFMAFVIAAVAAVFNGCAKAKHKHTNVTERDGEIKRK